MRFRESTEQFFGELFFYFKPSFAAILALASFLMHWVEDASLCAEPAPRPNIVFILADDLGYGDVQSFGGQRCQIETPGFDRMAREGMRFTDAHVNASICVPTRIAIMTGRYPWRFGPPAAGGPWGFLGLRFPVGTSTLGTILQSAGYRTGYVGKWHLGTKMQTKNGEVQGPENVDYTKPIEIGPANFGFDDSFILPGSLDMFPYAFVRNHRWVGEVTAKKGWSAFNRIGPAAEEFEDTKVLSNFRREAKRFLETSAEASRDGKPFFLYLALTAPHTPLSPSKEFAGRSKLGVYGDFVMEADHCVQSVLDNLDQLGLADNTLVIATSDHGPAAYAGRQRKATFNQMRELEEEGHYAGGPFRGYKFSIYEGGLRVPFVARWPAVTPAGTTCDQLIGLQDLLATVAALSGVAIADDQAPDSFNLTSLLADPEAPPVRQSIILDSSRATAIRKGKWKLALCPGSGCEGRFGNLPRAQQAWQHAVAQQGSPIRSRDELINPAFVQLFDLDADPGESHNLAAERMDLVESMYEELVESIERGRTTSGPPQQNDRPNLTAFRGVPDWVLGQRQTAKLTCLETDEEIVVSFDGKTLLQYNKAIRQSPQGLDPIYARSGYLHPVMTPGGREVTGDFPPDHAHQHAIFSALVNTSLKDQKIDFWNQRAGLGRIRHRAVRLAEANQESVTIEVELSHEQTPANGKIVPVISETWLITVFPPQGDKLIFDLQSSQTCVADTPLEVHQHRYGGMAVRGNNQWFSEASAKVLGDFQKQFSRAEQTGELEQPGLNIARHRFLTSDGMGRFSGNHTRPTWVDLTGMVDETYAGITVMSHPDNFRHPQPVRLHPTKPYFCFAPMVLGSYQLKPDQPLISRYRFVAHDKLAEVSEIDSWWAQWLKTIDESEK